MNATEKRLDSEAQRSNHEAEQSEGIAQPDSQSDRSMHPATSAYWNRSASPARRGLSTLILYSGFAATGIGMSLPGSVLPALLARLSLNDNQAGFFFFVGWLGTSIGALLVRRSRVASIALASSLTALGSSGLAYSNHHSWLTLMACYAAMACYGTGLGMAMTAISLHQAALHVEHRAMELNRLNLIWALGALAGPVLGAHSLRVASVRSIYSSIGLFFALFALWVFVRERDVAVAETAGIENVSRGRGQWPLAAWPLPILLVIFLPTGMEASMGAWTAAYVQRSHQAIATTVTAGSCFWLGLLLSRAVSTFLLQKRRVERTLLTASLLVLVTGSAVLMATTATTSTLPALFLIGFGLGPVYPLLLAIALAFSDATPIFFLAGLGSAFMPWLTGIVSAQAHSLRIGLVVPLAASVAMLLLSLRLPATPLQR